jgi:hypothetical protein
LGPYKLPVIFENKQYVVQTRARTHFSFFYWKIQIDFNFLEIFL